MTSGQWVLVEVCGPAAVQTVEQYGDKSFAIALGCAQLFCVDCDRSRSFQFGWAEDGKFNHSRDMRGCL